MIARCIRQDTAQTHAAARVSCLTSMLHCAIISSTCTYCHAASGEMDKLALEEAGFSNVVSVPDGAPAKVKEAAVPSPDADTKYSYLWNCRAVLDQATRILMATDNDPPGHALAEELARRLGEPPLCVHACEVLLL